MRLAARTTTRWVDELTSVKLSATARRDVYRTRPFVEQAWWVDLIRSTPDPGGRGARGGRAALPAGRRRAGGAPAGLAAGPMGRGHPMAPPAGAAPAVGPERLQIRRHTKGLDR